MITYLFVSARHSAEFARPSMAAVTHRGDHMASQLFSLCDSDGAHDHKSTPWVVSPCQWMGLFLLSTVLSSWTLALLSAPACSGTSAIVVGCRLLAFCLLRSSQPKSTTWVIRLRHRLWRRTRPPKMGSPPPQRRPAAPICRPPLPRSSPPPPHPCPLTLCTRASFANQRTT